MRPRLFALLTLVLLALVACVPSGETLEDTTVPEDTPEPAPETSGEESTGNFEPRPHRDAPAVGDIIVSDSAEFYAATGNPQLIEIFTVW